MQASVCNASMRHNALGATQHHRQASHYRPAVTLHGSWSLGQAPAACPGPRIHIPHNTWLLTAAVMSDHAPTATTSSDDSSMTAAGSTSTAADASNNTACTTTTSSSSVGSDAGSKSSSETTGYQQHDILCCTCDSTPAQVYLEVISPPAPAAAAGSMICTRQGVTYMVAESDEDGSLTATPTGWHLTANSQLVATFPGWAQQLQQLRQRTPLPTQPLHLQAPALVGRPTDLQQRVAAEPQLWRDGTGPGDAPLQGAEQQLLCAGELECLLQRQRGVVMVQLCAGWDTSGAAQPVDNPLVVYQLQQVLERPDLSIFMSQAPGGLGLTAIITAKAEPYRSWGAHLASFGAQAALVAESPYYKLLIGRVLGYKEDNIVHHIRSVHGLAGLSQAVREAVAQELRGLSKVPPVLPWVAPPAASNKGKGGKAPAKGNRRRR